MRYRSLLVLLVLPILALSLPAFAAGGVKDNAGMFSSNAVMVADATIAKIKTQFKDDLLIETFAEVPAELRTNLTDANRAQVYEQWARERARQNQVDGVYVMLTKNPGRLQVEVGNRTGQREFTIADRDALTRRMLEGLKANQPDQALLTGVKFVYDTYAANMGSGKAASGAAVGAAGAGAAGSKGAQPTANRKGGVMGLFSGSCFLWLIIGGVIFMLFRVFANRAARGAGYGAGGPGGYGPGRYGQPGQPGQPPYGQPGYGQGGYPNQGAPGGGGFGRGLMGGLLGGMAGGYLWDRMSGQGSQNSAMGNTPQGSEGAGEAPPDTDYSGGGADFGGGGDSGGGDFGGGGGDSGGGGGDF